MAERDLKLETGMRAPMPGALNSMSPRVVVRHMSVFGGVEIVNDLVVSDGTVELDALIASYWRDIVTDCGFLEREQGEDFDKHKMVLISVVPLYLTGRGQLAGGQVIHARLADSCFELVSGGLQAE